MIRIILFFSISMFSLNCFSQSDAFNIYSLSVVPQIVKDSIESDSIILIATFNITAKDSCLSIYCKIGNMKGSDNFSLLQASMVNNNGEYYLSYNSKLYKTSDRMVFWKFKLPKSIYQYEPYFSIYAIGTLGKQTNIIYTK